MKEKEVKRVHCENCSTSGMDYDFVFDPEVKLYFCNKKCKTMWWEKTSL